MSLAYEDGPADRELIADEGCWFCAWREGSAVKVYKSIRLVESWSMFRPVLDLVGSLVPRQVSHHSDETMMGYAADLVSYDL